MWGLPFGQIWCIDFEFTAEPGALPVPVCLVGHELATGRLIRLWQDDLPARPPFDTGDETLFVAYYASAEVGCFLALGWPVPARLLDLFTEFRNETNGLFPPLGNGLLSALAWHDIPAITKEQKQAGRDLVLRGGPWTVPERRDVLDYCQTDVDPLGPLLERMLPRIRRTRRGLGQALLRGRYMTAAARIERAGIPVDMPLLAQLRDRWESIQLDLIREVDEDYGVYEGTTFKAGLWAAWCVGQGITWPLLDSGYLALDGDTFRDMSLAYPQVGPVKELRASLGEMRLADLAVGPDGRNRVMLSAFQARTGRNQPSTSRFIFGPAVWMRGLIKPAERRALAYVDWSAQEVAIAAVLSGDLALLDAVISGDPYIAFAIRAGLAPAGATKDTHPQVRDLCKTCLLGTRYGMGARSLACRTGLSVVEAQHLLRRLALAYPGYDQWARQVTDTGLLGGRLATRLGWTLHVGPGTGARSLRNFPMQSHGAEVLRLACCLATERGITVGAAVHDAALIEADADCIDDVVGATRAAMAEASRLVLYGHEVGTDAKIVRWPDRYADPRGAGMWQRVTALLQASTADQPALSDGR
jgi:hypothetical protein